MPETLSGIFGSLIEALIGGVVGVFLTLLTFRLQQRRKIIEYETFSMPLIRFKPTPERSILVSVDKSLLTSKEEDKGDLIQVDSAYGFEIKIQNVGSQPIENCIIEINLDSNAKILESETQPPSKPGRKITSQRDEQELSVLRVTPEYINKKDTILVRITSTGNKSQKCEVNVMGMGLHVRERSFLRAFLWPAIGMMVPMILLLLLPSSPENPIAQQLMNRFNLPVKEESRIDWPMWVILPPILLVMIPVYLVMLREAFKTQRKRRSWSTELSLEKTSLFKDFIEWLRE
jgi:uncharacterized membrane protein